MLCVSNNHIIVVVFRNGALNVDYDQFSFISWVLSRGIQYKKGIFMDLYILITSCQFLLCNGSGGAAAMHLNIFTRNLIRELQ